MPALEFPSFRCNLHTIRARASWSADPGTNPFLHTENHLDAWILSTLPIRIKKLSSTRPVSDISTISCVAFITRKKKNLSKQSARVISLGAFRSVTLSTRLLLHLGPQRFEACKQGRSLYISSHPGTFFCSHIGPRNTFVVFPHYPKIRASTPGIQRAKIRYQHFPVREHAWPPPGGPARPRLRCGRPASA
jgi:hypothetical protein